MASVGKVGRVRRAGAGVRRRPAVLPRRLAPGDLGAGRCCRSSSGRSWPSCRPTSSGCSPTRRSATPASSSSAWRRPGTGPASPTPARASRRRSSTSSPTPCSSIGTFAIVALVARRGDGRPTSTRSAGSASSTRRWRWRSPSSSSPRPACRSRAASSPSSASISAAVDEHSYALAHHRDGRVGDRRVPLPADHGRDVDAGWRGRSRRPGGGVDALEAVPIPLATGVAIVAAAAFTLFVGHLPGLAGRRRRGGQDVRQVGFALTRSLRSLRSGQRSGRRGGPPIGSAR